VSAVFPRTGGEGMAVFVLERGRARLQPVTVAARNGSQAWVQDGLAAGARVIVYPPATVADGVRVHVRSVGSSAR
jgi:HlyD family secretion protein